MVIYSRRICCHLCYKSYIITHTDIQVLQFPKSRILSLLFTVLVLKWRGLFHCSYILKLTWNIFILSRHIVNEHFLRYYAKCWSVYTSVFKFDCNKFVFFYKHVNFLVYILISDDHLADELDTNGSILLPCWHKYVYLCIYF